MTLQREIAWQHLDALHRASISHQFARYALGLDYDRLPPEVVHEAKRCLLDALGCAIGAFDAPGLPICEAVAEELGGPEEATVFGSGLRTSASNATLVNSFLVRFLDFNDMGGGGHNSDSIPGLLAVAEREGASGRDFLLAVVISYELGARFAGSVKRWWDWFADTRAGLTMPSAYGRMMGLDAEQIANAIGICASGNMVLHIQDTSLEDKTMRKNIRFGWGACAAITACQLAREGFTGPLRVVEGEKGLNEVMFEGEMDLERLTDFRGWRTLNTRYKYYASQLNLQGAIGSTIAIVIENDLEPKDIASVNVRLAESDLTRPTVPVSFPRNAETADHSVFYLIAAAIKDRTCNADSILPEKFTDPEILALIEKVVVEGDSKLPQKSVESRLKLTTTDGRVFERHVVVPHGFGEDNLTDDELEDKFRTMALKYLPESQVRALIDTIWRVDSLDSIADLTGLMVVTQGQDQPTRTLVSAT